MRRAETAAVALAMLGLACNGDVPTGTLLKPASTASRDQSRDEMASRPISGRCESKVVSVEFLSPTTAREAVTGPCQISHLGRATLYLQQVIDFTTGRAVSEVVTFTAANGDVLRATSVTIGTPTGATTFSLAGTFTFVGGTGRFAHASGSAPFTGSVDFATGNATLTMQGRIAYDASDRAGG
jgi:hypothetical protein